MKIKNIIFDLGGVILNLDFQLTFDAFKKLGAHDFDYLTLQKISLENFEIGQIKASEFRLNFNNEFNLQVSDSEFDYAWNEMLLDLPQERLDFIKLLKEKHGFKTFLFSNINEIHLKEIRSQHSFSNCFIKEYYSNEFGKRKPDKDAFLTILKENDLVADETLFVDDTFQNIEAAIESGLHTMHIRNQVTILDLFKQLDQVLPKE